MRWFRKKQPEGDFALFGKAEIAARLIQQLWDEPAALAVEGLDKDPRPEALVQARVETAVFLVYVMDYLAYNAVGEHRRNEFIDWLFTSMAGVLEPQGIAREGFRTLLGERSTEYAKYRWLADADEGAKGTLLWEFANRMAAILDAGKNATYNVTLSHLMIKAIARWNLAGLLKAKSADDWHPDPEK